MEYIDSINIFGKEYKPNSCIILNNIPDNNTPGLIGMLAMNINSESKKLYKCIASAPEAYEWVPLGEGGGGNTSAEIVDSLTEISEPDEFTDYYVKSGSKYLHYRWSKELNDFVMIGTDAYSKNEVDNLIAPIKNQAESNATAIEGINETVGNLQGTIEALDKRPRLSYEATYGDFTLEDGTVQDSTFVLWEKEGDSGEPQVKSRFKIVGGGGGGEISGNTLTISYQKDESGKSISRYTFTEDNNNNNESKIYYAFSGKTPDNESVLYGEATWKLRRGTSGPWTTVATETIYPTSEGEWSSFNISQYVAIGSYQIMLTVIDESGGYATKTWAIQIVDLRLESTFDDTIAYPIAPVLFNYTPYGSVAKTIYFKLDGEDLEPVENSTSGISSNYRLPTQSHGAHLLEVYAEATINGAIVPTNHIFKDIIWYDSESELPVISCAQQSITMDQYDTINIEYTVYDPSTEKPTVIIREGDNVLATRVLSQSNTDLYTYNALDIFEGTEETHTHTLTLQCGDVEKQITIVVEKIGINIVPAEGDLAFDFNPIGYSNDSPNRLWEDSTNSAIKMSVTDNFDWNNGGYRYDNNGDQYFCIKAGSFANISYELFGENAQTKSKGKDFKLIFRAVNVSNPQAKFLECVDKTDEVKEAVKGYYFEGNFYSVPNQHEEENKITPQVDTRYYDQYGEKYYTYRRFEEEGVVYYRFVEDASGIIGVEMKVHDAYIYDNESKYLHLPYSEEDIIEFEFNINKSTNNVPMIMGYEDGVATTPLVYGGSSSFNQRTPQEITLGSEYCDLWIYRFKVYERELTDKEILNNFIADARSPQEMVSRYNRNQIYDKETTLLTPESVADACPWLRVIKIDTPKFTNDKDERLTTNFIQQIYKGGKLPTDNWTAYYAAHSGQGTSSNNYGPAGRNLDLMLKKTKSKQTGEVINPNFNGITLAGETGTVDEVPLSENSIPVDYFNVKVNIASSENANNALLQKRYNDYNPYQRPFVREEGFDTSKIKDTMEFYNCVIFLRETDETQDEQGNYINHREFNDTNWHFYAIGNIGDSKKTDDTRLTDPDDPYECINEIIDVDVPLASFPRGAEALATLARDNFDKKGSYEWRYIWEDGSDSENEEVFNYCKQKWIDFYTFVVTSTDEEFKRDLSNYFVVESALYYYLFTTRFTMVDNRAKNSFWHYGKTGEIDENGEPIRKWDLAFDYDNDTALGIDNDGDMVYRYGLEDTDKDENGIEVFRVSNSTFFTRIRDLFAEELAELYIDLATAKSNKPGAWDANDTITTFDKWQNQFPEELWRLDIERKYIRTYTSSYINGNPFPDALVKMAHGKKKYQRREFERNQEKYMASKYLAIPTLGDKLTVRCVDTRTSALPQGKSDYKIEITPYSYMYLQAEFGNGNFTDPVRAEPGKTYTIQPKEDKDFVDIINIYGSEGLQSIGDISLLYPKSVLAPTAHKLKELIIGSKNSSITSFETLGIGGTITDEKEPLIELLNVENVSGSSFTDLDLKSLRKLKTLKASGAGPRAVTFANQGLLENAELPPMRSVFMSNLRKLNSFTFDENNYGQLENLFIENSNIDNDKDGVDDLINIIPQAAKLDRVRITGINWILNDTSVLDILYKKRGYGRTKDEELPHSVLAGAIKIVGTYRQRDIEQYLERWSELTIDVSEGTEIKEALITYLDWDNEVVHRQYIDVGTSIPFITEEDLTEGDKKLNKPEDNKFRYTFLHWKEVIMDSEGNIEDIDNGKVITPTQKPIASADTIVKAVYEEHPQIYTVIWKSYTSSSPYEQVEIARQENVDYMSEAVIDETSMEKALFGYRNSVSDYYGKLFKGWDTNTGYIKKSDKSIDEGKYTVTVEAIWEEAYMKNALAAAEERNIKEEALVQEINNYYGNGDYEARRQRLAQVAQETPSLSAVQVYTLSKSIDAEENSPKFEAQTLERLKEVFVPGSNIEVTMGHDFAFTNTESVEIVPVNETKFFVKDHASYPPMETGVALLEDNKDFSFVIDFEFTKLSPAGTLVSFRKPGASDPTFRITATDNVIKLYVNETVHLIGNTNMNFGRARNIFAFRYRASEKLFQMYRYSTSTSFTTSVPNVISIPITFSTEQIELGAIFSEEGVRSQGCCVVYWSKLWREDLGVNNLKKLVMWPREKMKMQYVTSTATGYVPNGLTFHSEQILLDRTMNMSFKSNAVLDQNGRAGWGETVMRQFLNNQFYNGLSEDWKNSLRLSTIKSLRGDSESIETIQDYVYIPSVLEFGADHGDRYDYEGFPFSPQLNWIRSQSKYSPFDLIYRKTEDAAEDPYNKAAEGDRWERGSDYIRVSQEIVDKYQLTPTIVSKNADNENDGGWIHISEEWTRSPHDNNRNWYVNNQGGMWTSAQKTSSLAICPTFSI